MDGRAAGSGRRVNIDLYFQRNRRRNRLKNVSASLRAGSAVFPFASI